MKTTLRIMVQPGDELLVPQGAVLKRVKVATGKGRRGDGGRALLVFEVPFGERIQIDKSGRHRQHIVRVSQTLP